MFDWQGKTVLVTGGTGTFGQAFIRFLLENVGVSAIRVFSRDELKQWEFRRHLPDDRLRFLIGDVRDRDRLLRAFDGVDVVVHAAALKQVPSCEYNPFEAVKTNVLGAQNVVDAAIERGVERVIALSTDKAANPINLYGATKLCAEKLFVQGNNYAGSHQTRFSVVRYGNVAASRGSVIPLFIEQRAKGQITITDRRMTRFWVTVRQAVELVKGSIEVMRGGEIFVPRLPSVRVVDIAEVIAPGSDFIEIGVRPGEKLHETLVTIEESPWAIVRNGVFVIAPESVGPSLRQSGDEPLADPPYTSETNSWRLTKRQIADALPLAISEASHYEVVTAPVSAGPTDA